jgi:DNA-binding NarL/FixJ family response regulator
MLRIAILHDPLFRPELPSLPATPAMRVTARVSLHDRYRELIGATVPNVILADLRSCADRTGDIIPRLRAALPTVSILVVGAIDGVDAARAALRGGAAGYVTRDASRFGLMTALDSVAQGQMFVSRTGRTAIRQLLDEVDAGADDEPA